MISIPRFQCLPGCNHCCIWRDYYHKPNAVRYEPKTGKYGAAYEYLLGKQGIEVQPYEVHRLGKLAKKLGDRFDEGGKLIKCLILPHIALSHKDAEEPERIVSYQLMGRTVDGDICPFLSTLKENLRTPAGALACLIYEERPLWCKAYPLQAILGEGEPKRKAAKYCTLDKTACQWVMEQLRKPDNAWMAEPFPIDAIKGLDYSAMMRIQTGKYSGLEKTTMWRYATGIHNQSDPKPAYVGWINWGWN